MKIATCLFLVCFISSNGWYISAEYFTSTGHLKWLLEVEMVLANQLNDFVRQEELRIRNLKEFYGRMNHIENYTGTENNEVPYVENPVKSFQLMNRMILHWSKLKELYFSDENELLDTFHENHHLLPTEEDMDGAKEALIRLQKMFNLESKQIIEGIVKTSPTTGKLNADDAFDIGLKAFRSEDRLLTSTWMSEALHLIDIGRLSDTKTHYLRFQVLDYLHWLEYLNSNFKVAYKYAIELLKLEPANKRIRINAAFLNKSMQNNNKTKEESTVKMNPKETVDFKRKFYYTDDEDEGRRNSMENARVQALCRGETVPIPSKYTNKLICWFKQDHPLLILKPAKLERIYPRPAIILFRDMLTDEEIMQVKEIATPLLNRATVFNPGTGKLEVANYRVSKSAWLDENDDPLIQRIDNRISAYTDLDMKSAEKLQVANYGIGGFYAHHFDFARGVPLRPPPWKNRTDYTYLVDPKKRRFRANRERIATILIYMSDVEVGGNTAFLNIGQAVRPTKGTGVFWYNLNHDGSGDYDTRHAACPVLIGEKWVSNRWVHEAGQEFIRKCNLRPEDDW